MAASDALALPLKNIAYRVYFPVYLNTGALATGWTGAAATRSLDGGTDGAASNAPTEIATSSGKGYLDLTAAEMNTNSTVVTITVTNANALPTVITIYPATDVMLHVNVMDWNSTAVATPATAGIPEVDVKNINNVAASSVTTVSANLGTTQPVNFTGTGASALAKADTVDIAGSAVSTSSAQIGVNAVNWAGGAIPAPAVTGVPKIDLTYILGTFLTETAGQIAAGFKKWFNVATPTSTMNEVTLVDTTTNLTNGGSGTTSAFSGAAATQINAIQSKTDTIGSASLTFNSPSINGGTEPLVIGRSYKNAYGNAITFTVSNLSVDLTAPGITTSFRILVGTSQPFAGVATSATAGYIEIAASATTGWSGGTVADPDVYDTEFIVLDSGDPIHIVSGTIPVIRGVG